MDLGYCLQYYPRYAKRFSFVCNEFAQSWCMVKDAILKTLGINGKIHEEYVALLGTRQVSGYFFEDVFTSHILFEVDHRARRQYQEASKMTMFG